MALVVVDASFAAAWVLPDEQTEATDAILFDLRDTGGLVPSLFWHELRNLLLVAERRGRLEPGGAVSCMAQIRQLPLTDDGPGGDHSVLALGEKHALTAYDACYLALALAHRTSLASTDGKLIAAARSESVEVLGPLADEP